MLHVPQLRVKRKLSPGFIEKESSVCRFVNTYTDEEWNDYQAVQADMNLYQICCQNKKEGNAKETLTGFQPHDNLTMPRKN